MGEPLGYQENLEQRYGGVYDAICELGIPEEHFRTILDPGLRGGKLKHSYRYFQEHPRLFAPCGEKHVILTSNDLIAQGAIYAIQRSGRRVPEDVAVVGFDNISAAAYAMPSITTVAQDPGLLGEKCFELLMKRILNPSADCPGEMLPQQIALRESAPLAAENAQLAGLTIFEERVNYP